MSVLTVVKKNTETDSEHFDMDCNQAPSQPTREHGLFSSTYEPGNVPLKINGSACFALEEFDG